MYKEIQKKINSLFDSENVDNMTYYAFIHDFLEITEEEYIIININKILIIGNFLIIIYFLYLNYINISIVLIKLKTTEESS